MKVVYTAWLAHIFAPLCGAMKEHPFHGVNLNNESSIVRLVDELLKPAYDAYPPQVQMHLKKAFKYALNTFSDAQFEHLYQGSLPACSLPTYWTPREFYLKVWNIMFNEDYTLNPDDYLELTDYNLSPWEKSMEKRTLQNVKSLKRETR